MKRAAILTFIVLGVFMISLFASTASAMTAKGVPDVKAGDYVEYEFKMPGMTEGYENATVVTSNKVTVEKSEKVTVNGTAVDCWVTKALVHYEVKGSSSEGGMTVSIEMKGDSTVRTWLTKDTWAEVKSTDESYTYMKYDLPEGIPFMTDSEQEQQITSTSTAKTMPVGPKKTIAVGDEWTESGEYTETTETKTRQKTDGTWGEWTTTTDTSDSEDETKYKAESEGEVTVPAGKFKCIKILTNPDDTEYGKDYKYVDEKGVPVKTESLDEDGKTTSTMELKSYAYGGGGSSSEKKKSFLPGFEAFLVLSAGLLAVILVRKFKK